ncbi:PaaI family thioesterase [Mycolicibacterium sp. 050158]|uniref:PaaI family thioesterase n=1 Tax=Mycolicibacterium sp. 050158 TaxID=3090602 RepID=UPI00299EC90A|nr:PaaI family thioesterase [Mycolicibacterium sp. 050158]MDX1893102.1 PaaI family thioesterase [Mycolicibacterium sp. 050158]
MTAAGEPVPEGLYAGLTDSVRRLVDVTIRSQAGPAALAAAQAKIDAAVDDLSHDQLTDSFGIRLAPGGTSRAWGNVVMGLRNAFAPPLVVHRNAHDGRTWADVTLGAAYEGPPGHVHGGICALLLDHMLGATAHEPGRPAVTGTLTIRYEAGTPLGPLHAEARVDRVEGRKTFAVGHLATAEGVTVRAHGVFFHPGPPAR